MAFWIIYIRYGLDQGIVIDLEQPPVMPVQFVAVTHKILIALACAQDNEYATSLGIRGFMSAALGNGVLDCAGMIALDEFIAEQSRAEVQYLTAEQMAELATLVVDKVSGTLVADSQRIACVAWTQDRSAAAVSTLDLFSPSNDCYRETVRDR